MVEAEECARCHYLGVDSAIPTPHPSRLPTLGGSGAVIPLNIDRRISVALTACFLERPRAKACNHT